MGVDQQAARLPKEPRENPRATVDAIEKKLDQQYPDRSVPDEQPSSVEKDRPSEPSDVTRTSDPEPPD